MKEDEEKKKEENKWRKEEGKILKNIDRPDIFLLYSFIVSNKKLHKIIQTLTEIGIEPTTT